MDDGDGHEMRLRRPQFFDSGSYYGPPSGSSLMYGDPYAYGSQPPPFPVVRVRGLPFDCVESDVLDFFHDLHILDVLFVNKGGRFSGEAFCVLAYPLQVDFAVQRNMRNMGRRYVEVFRSKRQEYYSAVAHEVSNMTGGSPRQGASRAKPKDDKKELVEHTGVLRMRGLPYSAGKDDILEFFKDYQLSEYNVHVAQNSEGRPSGEAFVEFDTAEDSKSAMEMDRKMLGSRYVELFPSTPKEMLDSISRAQ